MDDQPPEGGASLPGGAHCGEEDRPDGQFEVGVVHHDDGVVAAEFEDRTAEAGWPPPPPPSCPTPVEPVAEIRGRRRSLIMRSPTTDPLPTTRLNTPSNPDAGHDALRRSWSRQRRSAESPTRASRRPCRRKPRRWPQFQDHTATGKLKAVMTPTGPSGCHCSYIRWRGRSETIVRP